MSDKPKTNRTGKRAYKATKQLNEDSILPYQWQQIEVDSEAAIKNLAPDYGKGGVLLRPQSKSLGDVGGFAAHWEAVYLQEHRSRVSSAPAVKQLQEELERIDDEAQRGIVESVKTRNRTTDKCVVARESRKIKALELAQNEGDLARTYLELLTKPKTELGFSEAIELAYRIGWHHARAQARLHPVAGYAGTMEGPKAGARKREASSKRNEYFRSAVEDAVESWQAVAPGSRANQFVAWLEQANDDLRGPLEVKWESDELKDQKKFDKATVLFTDGERANKVVGRSGRRIRDWVSEILKAIKASENF